MHKVIYDYDGNGWSGSNDVKQLIGIDITFVYVCKNVKLDYDTNIVVSTIVLWIEMRWAGEHINKLPVNEMQLWW